MKPIHKAISGRRRISRICGCCFAALFVVLQPSAGLSQNSAADAPTTSPVDAKASVSERAIQLLVAGKQSVAVGVLEESRKSAAAAGRRPDVDEVFLMAVLTRSCFYVEEAVPLFGYVKTVSPDSPHGRAAEYILQLDAQAPDLERNFKALQTLASEEPVDPLILWMLGVQCRSLNRNRTGVAAYAELCKLWDPGPVLVHQTYANLLDQLRRYDESLVHRQLAVKLEPASWSYDGLGNTLTSLKRWEEADAAYAHATELAPRDAHSWTNWALSKSARGDVESAGKMNAKARELKAAAGQ